MLGFTREMLASNHHRLLLLNSAELSFFPFGEKVFFPPYICVITSNYEKLACLYMTRMDFKHTINSFQLQPTADISINASECYIACDTY